MFHKYVNAGYVQIFINSNYKLKIKPSMYVCEWAQSERSHLNKIWFCCTTDLDESYNSYQIVGSLKTEKQNTQTKQHSK